jgi:hypothetical protein
MLKWNLRAKTTAEHGTAGTEEQQTLISKRENLLILNLLHYKGQSLN